MKDSLVVCSEKICSVVEPSYPPGWVLFLFVLFTLAGLAAAVYNITDEEGRMKRIEARKAQRKKRKRPWVWPT